MGYHISLEKKKSAFDHFLSLVRHKVEYVDVVEFISSAFDLLCVTSDIVGIE
jgi:hypothetical protein